MINRSISISLKLVKFSNFRNGITEIYVPGGVVIFS